MNTTRFLRSAIALAIGAVAMGHAAHADIVSSASLSIDNLRYRLIDLAPDDGIAPSITFQGAWTATNNSFDPVDASMINLGWSLPSTTAKFLETAQGHLFDAGAGAEGTVSGDLGYANVGSTQFGSVSVLQSDRFTTVVDDRSYQYTFPNTDEQGNPILVTNKVSDLHLLGAGRSDTTLFSHAPGSQPGSLYTPGFEPSTFTLSANTILILEGTAHSSLAVDRSNLIAAQNLLPAVDEGSENFQVTNLSAWGTAAAALEISLTDADYFLGTGAVNQHGASFNSWRVLNYNEHGFLVPTPGAPNGADNVYDTSVTASQSFSDDIRLVYANVDGASKEMTFYVRAQATTEQLINGNHYAVNSTTVPAPVPEPGTYAMMGLGLVGLMMLRRRREFV